MSNQRDLGTAHSGSIDENFPTSDKRDPRASYFSFFHGDQTTNLEPTPVSADFWVAALILGLGGFYLLVIGAFFLIQVIWVPLLLAYCASILGFILYHGQKVAPKVRLAADTDVCQLLKLDNCCAVVLGVRNYLNEQGNPRGTYLSIKTEGSYVVDVVVPGLNEYGKIVLNRSSHVLKAVAIEWSASTRPTEYAMLRQLAPMIQEYYQLEAEIAALRAQKGEIDRLITLLSTSDMHLGAVGTYQRASVGIDTLLLESKELRNLYRSLVQEGLLARKVHGYSPENMPLDASMLLDSRYEAARVELQSMRETARTYAQLLKSRRA